MSNELKEFKDFTLKMIQDLPRSWQKLGLDYLHRITKREIIELNVLAILTGVIAGYASIGFRYLIGVIQNLTFHGTLGTDLVAHEDIALGWWIFIIVPAGLLISAYLTRWFAPEAKGHGVPEVIESVLVRGGKMRKRLVLIKSLASAITIAAGGSVGREGPIVQIGAAAGSVFGQYLKLNTRLLKTLVGCGAAGGIAASFNTPIAGVIFAIEIIILELKTKSFVPLVISTVFACLVSRIHLGNEPSFWVPSYSLVDSRELIFYFVLGVLAGVVGHIVVKTVYGIEDLFDKAPIPFFFKPLIGGLIVASIGFYYPQIFGVGYEAMSRVLREQGTLELMALLVVLKIVAVSVTLGAGGSGGVFSPALFIGAMVGGAYGYLVHSLYPTMTSGFGPYALVGMAAVFSSTSRATFTAIVILFEMTMDYSLILPLMFVCVTADQVAWALSSESIYSLKLKRKGLSFVTDIGVNLMCVTRIKDVMTQNPIVVSEEMTLNEAEMVISKDSHATYPVVNSTGALCGLVSLESFRNHMEKQPPGKNLLIKEIKTVPKTIVHLNDTVDMALKKLEKTRDPRIIVVDQSTQKVVGIVSPIDLVRLSSTETQET